MSTDPLFSIFYDWEVSTLGDIVARGGGSIQTGPFGSQLHASDYVDHGIPSIMPQNIVNDRISEEGIARITEEDAKRLSKYRVRKGDIIYSRRGDVERRALVRQEHDGWLCGTGCLKVSFGHGLVVPEYAAFYLSHPASRSWVVQHAVGATMPNLNTSILSALPFVLPPISEQKRIADALGSLDDKIELNRRMNETLEEMARALFRDWFIDFSPTRRQMDGATDPAAIMGHAFPDNKAAALAPLFPERLGEDGLPEGWKMGTLKDYGIVKNGFAFKSKDWRDMGIPVLKIKNVKPRLVSLDGCGFIDIGLAREKSNFQLQSGDILVGMTGYVGEVGRVPETKPLPMLNQRVGHIKAEYLEGFSPFIFSCTRQPEFKEHAVARSHGSAQANVSTKDLELFGVVIAGKTIVAAYDQFAMPIFDRMQLADTENKTLAEMRDLLLPKLMSGEIQLKDAWRDL